MSGTALDIRRDDDEAGGRYWAVLAADAEAEMTYRWARPNLMLINHTGVPQAHEGKGYALQLVKRAVADARAEGFSIIPQCPYVDVQFRRHGDWADLLAQ